MRRRVGWWVMTVLAMAISLYAAGMLLVPAIRPPFIASHPMPLVVAFHFGGGALALAVGPFQFLAALRTRRLNLHRWLGRTYLAAVLAGGLAGLTLAPLSQAGLVAHFGFGLLAVAWLGTTAAAYLTIRRGDERSHQAWMTRSFALTYAAVTLRVYLPLSLASGLPFDAAYSAIAWACWVPNLAVAEWVVASKC